MSSWIGKIVMILNHSLSWYYKEGPAAFDSECCRVFSEKWMSGDMSVAALSEYNRSDNSVQNLRRYQQVVQLPVAPQLTARTRFASTQPRKICFLTPEEAVALCEETVEAAGGKLTMAAISGPGDPLAVPDTTFKTIALVKETFPDISLGIKTLGIGGEAFASELAQAGVDYVELQVDGVQAEILEKLYAWIRPGQKTLKISEAVQLMLREQRNCVPAMKYNGIDVSILTTLYPGYNLDHVKILSRKMMELGADSISLVPYAPEADAEVILEPPAPFEINSAKKAAGGYLPILEVPLLTRRSASLQDEGSSLSRVRSRPQPNRPNVAVVSSNGMDVDLHLGHAGKVLIYGPRGDGLTCLLEARALPKPGTGAGRWRELATVIDDCFAILTASAGENPRKILSENGVRVMVTEEPIEGCVDMLYEGGRKGKCKR